MSNTLLERHTQAKEKLDQQAQKIYEIRASIQSLTAEEQKLRKEAIDLLGLKDTATFEEISLALEKKEKEELDALVELERVAEEVTKNTKALSEKLEELTLF